MWEKKRKVFGHVVQAPQVWNQLDINAFFLRKKQHRNDKIGRYNTWFVAQGFLQILKNDFDETYSPIMVASNFRYLISFVVHERISLHMLDIVANISISFDSEIYMKLLKIFNSSETHNFGYWKD